MKLEEPELNLPCYLYPEAPGGHKNGSNHTLVMTPPKAVSASLTAARIRKWFIWFVVSTRPNVNALTSGHYIEVLLNLDEE